MSREAFSTNEFRFLGESVNMTDSYERSRKNYMDNKVGVTPIYLNQHMFCS